MYRNWHNDVPKLYYKNMCTEIDLICTKVVMYQYCPPPCTEIDMYRKWHNPDNYQYMEQVATSVVEASSVNSFKKRLDDWSKDVEL